MNPSIPSPRDAAPNNSGQWGVTQWEAREKPAAHIDGAFCGECGDYIKRQPMTFIVTDTDDGSDTRLLCPKCADVFGLIIGHDYTTGECPCGGDARGHGYLNHDGS